jgi:hypothetical protein
MKLKDKENRRGERQRMLSISPSLSTPSPANSVSGANAGPRHCAFRANAEEMKIVGCCLEWVSSRRNGD